MSPLAIQGDTIYDLPAVANAATEVPGALWEVEVLAGPVAGAYVNKKLTTEQYVEYLRGQGLGGTPRIITHATLLAEFNAAGGVMRQQWYTVTDRPSGLPDITFYCTDAAEPAGICEYIDQNGGGRALGFYYPADDAQYPANASQFLQGSYTVQAADVTSPASAITIAVPSGLAFGQVGIAKPGVSGQDILTPGADYTSAAGSLTILASLSPPLAAGDVVHYSYLTGSANGSSVDPAISFPYAPLSSGSWDVTGKKHAAAYLALTSSTTLSITGAPDGFVGTLLVINTQNGPLPCALPAGSYGPKNYQPSFAASERRMLTATYAQGTWYFNSAIYYPQ